mmetsp:Transcript_2617/g.7877  ORF Transcript_2617/g.7877 Transcript_2617/m.7877 type:complete len:220 (+) Transcript_2617:228-887(+)|eukprot:CAMPEP_0198729516 /NCGR_PEP_ID=MMETSP1475-20131203/19103_1 /TAXON_ID= ORGANISM="Unidentified sp., Strain CCMP1999" /NCGR_SAMPLE_ID=MMETSP1475 /ASSEMBLY_ACC=CAM_ASM_001111 /LENGTH=219 /DNA_ID=CAMNT_0044492191 /DNA_START=239 /DNA_END=898 /DNA_ORIENTATION=-
MVHFRKRRAKKIIFLDVDGVLHSVYVQVLKDQSKCFDPRCMDVLRQVAEEHRADVVLSSNWRLDSEGWKIVQKQLRKYNIRLIGKTPVIETSSPQANRVTEIHQWISENRWMSGWIAIDDMDLETHCPKELASFFEGHFVRTQPRGLEPDDVEKCREKFGTQELPTTDVSDSSFSSERLRQSTSFFSGKRAASMINFSKTTSMKVTMRSPGIFQSEVNA